MSWKEALENKAFRVHLLLGILGLGVFALVLPYYFNQVLLNKPGIQLSDPVLGYFSPRNWSTEIFILLYCCTALFLAFNFKDPKTILKGVEVYVVINFTRMLTLYLFTLEAPNGIIPLEDPFLTQLVYRQPVYVKDLFFSGHVSTLFLVALLEKRKGWKLIFLMSTAMVGALLAWQRVHYTLDILAAPLVTWFVFRFFSWYNQQVIFQKGITETALKV